MGQAGVKRAATFDIDRVMPSNARLYEWCQEQPLTEASSHLFFSPHLDDAVLSCGGLIDALVSQKKAVKIITVFAGEPATELSAFARHLHSKWRSTIDLFEQRRQEDTNALTELGVEDFEQWTFAEAPYRCAGEGDYLYGTYNELLGPLSVADEAVKQRISEKVLRRVAELSEASILYFPLSLGRHVDHQMLFTIGLELNAAGKRVRFYEDYPYAEAYSRNHEELNWLPRTISIAVGPKLRAASAYKTQMRGLGGSVSNLEKRLRAFGSTVEGRGISERYWELLTTNVAAFNENQRKPISPFRRKTASARLRDFRELLKTFRWHDLAEILPVGTGNCLDLGCGSGRHRALIENRGYRWFGLDRGETKSLTMRSDGESLPLRSGSMAAAVAWQMFEYLESPEKAIAEIARVLDTGGVFCGSVSFLEPVHGRTYFNLSPLILEKLLTRHGFADIEIKSGLNGFALMLWTLLRRSAIPFADRLAVPAAFVLLFPPAGLLFCASWLAQRLGFGGGHMMEWLSKRAPLEFAGHVMFSARKKARP